MHTRPPQSRAPRRSSSRPLDVAASLVLTVGLLGCAAPVAQAAETAPASAGSTPAAAPLPQAAPTVTPSAEHPALERSVTATFETLEGPTEPGNVPQTDVRAMFTVHLKNTGDVPLNVFLRAVPQPGNAPLALAVGESKDVSGSALLTSEDLRAAAWFFASGGDAYTPTGAKIDAGVTASLPVPGRQPNTPVPAPSPSGTPSTPQPSTPSGPGVVEHPALERWVTATFEKERGGEVGVTYYLHFKNTGDVPLSVHVDALQIGYGDFPLAPGETRVFGSYRYEADVSELEDGSWSFRSNGDARSPGGARLDASITAEVPTGRTPKPTPSPTSTPSPSTPTPAPTTASTGPLTVTAVGKFLTKPGEPVKEGTRVEFTYTATNTSGADLTEIEGRTLAPGESLRLTRTEVVVTAQNLEDGSVPAKPEPARATLPGGSRLLVLGPVGYELAIPDKPPVAVEAPDLDVKVSGTFQVKEGEPVVAGTKVKWVAELTNTGDVALRDVQVADSEKLAELAVGETGVVSFETEVTERDVFNHSIWVASLATATTPEGTAFSESTLGTLAIPAVVPVTPVTPAPTVTPTPVGPDAKPTATPLSGGATRPAAEITVPTAPAASAATVASSSKQSSSGRLASTGSDAAAALPAAGVLTLLGALGVLLGRRRRRTVTD